MHWPSLETGEVSRARKPALPLKSRSPVCAYRLTSDEGELVESRLRSFDSGLLVSGLLLLDMSLGDVAVLSELRPGALLPDELLLEVLLLGTVGLVSVTLPPVLLLELPNELLLPGEAGPCAVRAGSSADDDFDLSVSAGRLQAARDSARAAARGIRTSLRCAMRDSFRVGFTMSDPRARRLFGSFAGRFGCYSDVRLREAAEAA